ncbi:hypothetical protein IYX23_17815 [Methylocystis sp. L43]|uniref:hypothetical protein n=1 Tax=unclassified Methylocystis TaxID=2625913 RepID=UPI0018C2C807|nr:MULTISPECIES: hypothetical protein [unclassified Methylocystis]MBG0799528.1 hypothetical protein [Methylocystis sp. L43]MBG0807311.1 hypothetical protein [Methylocystis sp. H15]
MFRKLNIIAQVTETATERRGIYATLIAHSITEEADALVAKLSAKVCERRTNRGREAAIHHAVGAFLADLLRAEAWKNAQGWVYRSLKTEAFSGEEVSYRAFKFVVESLVALGWLQHVEGKRFWTANAFDPSARPFATGGHASRFRMTPALKALCEGVTSDHFIEPLPANPVVLRAAARGRGENKTRGKMMPVPQTEYTTRLIKQMKELNQFLSEFEMRPYRFTGLVRNFNEGDKPSFDWNKGGRLYARGELQYQFQSKEDRAKITLDGEATTEVDIRASFLATYHGLMKQPFDPNYDPYEVEGIHRDAVKLWMLATFGSQGHIRRWPNKLAEDYREKHGIAPPKVSKIKEAMVAMFPVLAEWGNSGHTWADLQFHESDAVFAAIFMLMKVHRIPAYPIHDSVIVRARDAEVAKEFIATSYKTSLQVDIAVR